MKVAVAIEVAEACGVVLRFGLSADDEGRVDLMR